MNAYIIRKALIRKHYLSATISSWLAKNPKSCLSRHFAPAVDFEVDYAEFLDDALLEAYELHEAFARNADKPAEEREWWILKPGMSDRGQGIRLFSDEAELQAIFEQWEAENPDSEEEAEDEEDDAAANKETPASIVARDFITTSHLRHFTAQPYISNPLLIPDAPFSNRKFHIRTYVVALGALKVYVYEHMLALFASAAYEPPHTTHGDPASDDEDIDLLQRLRDVHLTNTCVQSASAAAGNNIDSMDDSGSHVHLFSKLPLPKQSQDAIVQQIHDTTAELFRAALAHPVNFQPLPQSFEIFGFDFLVSADATSGETDLPNLNAWLLEVNAFPDFAQTGQDLRELVVQGLFDDVATHVIAPHYGISTQHVEVDSKRLEKVLDINLQRK